MIGYAPDCAPNQLKVPVKLTDAKLRTLKMTGKHADGLGLYLEVTAAGGRYWRMKYRFGGKEKRLAFGVYPTVKLKDARERRDSARIALERGDDPGALKKAAKVKAVHEAVNTLEAVMRDWLTHQGARWAPITLKRNLAALEADIFPSLGSRSMATISPREVMAAVQKIEARGAAEVAGRVLQRIKAAFRYAVIHHRIENNPMLDLKPSEILKPRKAKHRPALADRDLPVFLDKLAAYEGDPNTIHALRLLMLTATRPGEVRGARWQEFDLEAALWRIPAERMKMKVEHVVPLSVQAVAEVQAMKPLSGSGELVFPSPYYPNKPLSDSTFNSALARMGYKNEATAHGFRSLFSTVSNEAGWNTDVIESQLAHAERNQVRAAYNRSTYLKQRAQLVQWWGDYLDGRRTGKVIPMPRRAA
jgi:integrase